MRCLAMALALLAATAAAGLAGEKVAITLPEESIPLKPGPGMETTQTACRLCHSLDYIWTQPPGGRAQWQGVVTKMMTVFGAPISEQDAVTIVQYLSQHYGPQ